MRNPLCLKRQAFSDGAKALRSMRLCLSVTVIFRAGGCYEKCWRPLENICKTNALDEGYTSRIVRRLEELNLIDRDDKGALKPSHPEELLEAWLEAYDFSKHQLIKGHVAARSGEELLRKITRILSEQKVDNK
jgi:hypothetical protein